MYILWWIITVLFAVSFTSNTVLATTVAQKMSAEYSSWANVKNTFRLSFSTLDNLYEENNEKDVKKFIQKIQKRK